LAKGDENAEDAAEERHQYDECFGDAAGHRSDTGVIALLDGYLYEADRSDDKQQQYDTKHHRDYEGERKNEWSAHVDYSTFAA
jgi:hypothetical protein